MKKKILIGFIIVFTIIITMVIGWDLYVEVDTTYKSFEFLIPLVCKREVTTFFIADSFDANTINIWKAISSVPLQSSIDKSKYTDSVIIMPINNDELSKLIDRKNEYNSIIQQVRKLFLKDITSFDKDWREKFMDTVMLQ